MPLVNWTVDDAMHFHCTQGDYPQLCRCSRCLVPAGYIERLAHKLDELPRCAEEPPGDVDPIV